MVSEPNDSTKEKKAKKKKEKKKKKEDKRKWELVRRVLPFLRKKIAILVDGPNILRKEFNIRLEDIKDAGKELGRVQVAKVYLDRYAPEKLFEAISNSGFDPVVSAVDVHVQMAVDVMNFLLDSDIKLVMIASRHARCVPLLRKSKEKNVETAVIGFDPGFSIALQNAADYVFKLEV
ncbi:MAG: NYN domain-containing protein [Promethearchaeota archaeon]